NADITVKSAKGDTLFEEAFKHKAWQVVSLIGIHKKKLIKGTDQIQLTRTPDFIDSQGKIFIQSLKNNDPDIKVMQYFLDGGFLRINKNDDDGKLALFYAVQNQREDWVRILLSFGSATSGEKFAQKELENMARGYPSDSILRLILVTKQKLDMFRVTYYDTPKIQKTEGGSKTIVGHLERKKMINKPALYLALESGNARLAKKLVEGGDSLYVTFDDGLTPYELAIQSGDSETTSFVLKNLDDE
ncbi:MAG: hypothetical protein HRT90_05035, partial [Candidatus Margulisbacteria bacterium]|nr:hypothetical protein [Candidatus Margulisiibacteriota bacterium]